MSEIFILIPILMPIIGGLLLFGLRFRKNKYRNIYTFILVTLNMAFVLLMLIFGGRDSITVFSFTDKLHLSFRIDGMSCVFAGLVSILWPLASLYAFEYMEREERQNTFFGFYTITLGTVLGIACAGNMLTMYVFYELLTLVTFPLVMHPMTDKAINASRTYLCYSLGGAAFAFVGIIFVMIYGESLDFTPGGVMGQLAAGDFGLLRFVYVIAFCGFSVKAAMVPFSGWLIKAAVAPTPVTALLHAVAVVKAGAFAVMRLTYYIFGVDFLRGTWAQGVVMSLAIITILYGSVMAVKEQHLKRRLAYSTISNLSYILFGVTIMSPLGLAGALAHMVFHAVMKICSFFCAGAVMHKTDKNYIYELNGLGRKMKLTFACFTVAALSLVGIPPLAGFISKWRLAMAALSSESTLTYVGLGVLLVSAFLTAIYMLSIVVRAYFPADRELCEGYAEAEDPTWRMIVPVVLFAAFIIAACVLWEPLINMFENIAGMGIDYVG